MSSLLLLLSCALASGSLLDPLLDLTIDQVLVFLALFLVALGWGRYMRQLLSRRAALEIGRTFVDALHRDDAESAARVVLAHPLNPVARALDGALRMFLYQQSLKRKGAKHDVIPPVELALARGMAVAQHSVKMRMGTFTTATCLALALGVLGAIDHLLGLLSGLRAAGAIGVHGLAEPARAALSTAALGLVVATLGTLVFAWLWSQRRKTRAVLRQVGDLLLEELERRAGDVYPGSSSGNRAM